MDSVEHVMDGERTVLLETVKSRIKYIIRSVETLLDNDGILQIAGALYIHAVEEHGKYLYVELLSSNNGIVEVERLHFRSHVFKIELAKEDLPQNCFILKQGIFDPTIFQRAVFVSSLDRINQFLEKRQDTLSNREVKKLVNDLKGYVTR